MPQHNGRWPRDTAASDSAGANQQMVLVPSVLYKPSKSNKHNNEIIFVYLCHYHHHRRHGHYNRHRRRHRHYDH